MKTTRLAFNLFTDNTLWTDESEHLSPVELFSCDYAPYYWQAIKIRFPQYTAERETMKQNGKKMYYLHEMY